MGRIRLFPLLFQNGCSQSSRFLPQARRIVGSVDENGCLCVNFCLRMCEKVKNFFTFALRERAVFGAEEFNNRTFEGESFFINKSSVSHLKHVTPKSNSKLRENCPLHIACSDFTGDKALFVHTCHRQRWWISLQQR